jgi:hypothetical protein
LSCQLHILVVCQKARAPSTCWMWGWVGPRASQKDMEKAKFWSLLVHKLPPLGHLTHRQLLYLLLHPSCHWIRTEMCIPSWVINMFWEHVFVWLGTLIFICCKSSFVISGKALLLKQVPHPLFLDMKLLDIYILWRKVSYRMLRLVALVRTDVSEEPSASFIRVTRIGELGTTLAVTSNRHMLRRNTKWQESVNSEQR